METMSLLPGFRFSPTDVELIMFYLKRKVIGKKFKFEAIADVNIYKFLPWDLPDKSCLRSRDKEWYFFCPREKKYASGARVKRATEDGYWKTTGKARPIKYKDKTAGTVKTLVFHLGHAPDVERTDWVIHEYQILDDQLAADGVQDTYVLCKLFKKEGLGPKNGAQYGAPFNEEEWADDDIDDSQSRAIPVTSTGLFLTTSMQPENNTCLVTCLHVPGNASEGLPLPEALSSSVSQPINEVLVDENDGEIARLLGQFTVDDILLSHDNKNNQVDFVEKGKNKWFPSPDEYGIFNNLGDLAGWTKMNEDRCDCSGKTGDGLSHNNVLMEDAFIELNDFSNPLKCSAEAIGTDQSSGSDVFGFYNCDNIHNVQLESCSVVNQFASGSNQPYQMPEESSNLDVHQMVNNQWHEGSNAAYDWCAAHGELMYDGLMFDDMERAAVFSPPSGGSSMHIKAEVTHGAGECTDEALLFMMEESDSGCWCNLPPAEDMWFLLPMTNLPDFGFSNLVHLICWYFDNHNVPSICYILLYSSDHGMAGKLGMCIFINKFRFSAKFEKILQN